MQRRKFLQSSCNFCMLAAAGYLLPTLSSCSPAAIKTLQADIVNSLISLPLASINASGLQIIHPKNSLFDIAVQKKNEGSYEALLLQCTHQDNQLNVSSNGYTCSLHGSQFDKDGNVTHGPAGEALHKYKTSVENDQLIININS